MTVRHCRTRRCKVRSFIENPAFLTTARFPISLPKCRQQLPPRLCADATRHSSAKTEPLVIDDWGLTKLNAENRRDLLELIEDRYGIRSTVVTSQLPVENWHDVVGDPTLADAILDRLVHRACQINSKGESMRKRRRALTRTDRRSS